jgi:cytochrome c553
MLFALPASAQEEALEQEDRFEADLARVDEALRTNPTKALPQSLRSCLRQRNFAVELRNIGMVTRAERALKYCFVSLNLPEEVEKPKVVTTEELRARSEKEYEQTLQLQPDIANGLQLYRECAACHEPEGWGRTTGSVPQIAGQHRKVVIHQLTDFRAGNRESVLMAPYADTKAIGGPQAVADVAGYVSTLEMSVDVGHGDGKDLELGAQLYADNCARCHGANGEGDNDELVPRIQAQHYKYLLRQFEDIKSSERRNADPEMTQQVSQFTDREIKAVLDYTSRLLPPEELRAPEGWQNPDFARTESSIPP